MSLHRRAAQRDTNEPEIIRQFKSMHWRVVQHTKYDLDVCCPRCKRIYAVEVKTKAGRLTASQAALIESGWDLRIVRNWDDVLALIEGHKGGCGG